MSTTYTKHTQIMITPSVVLSGGWVRALPAYIATLWMMLFFFVAYAPLGLLAHWRHRCECEDCAFVEIGLNGKRWLRW